MGMARFGEGEAKPNESIFSLAAAGEISGKYVRRNSQEPHYPSLLAVMLGQLHCCQRNFRHPMTPGQGLQQR